MSASDRNWPRPGNALLGLLVVALCSAEECPSRPIVARVANRVEPDGTVERDVRLSGSTSDEKEPLDAAWWRDRAGLDLPARARWLRVDEGPGWIAAKGRFGDAASVPSPIGHLLPQGEVADRDAILLERRDLVLLTHFVYREEYGDPFDETARAGALDSATDRGTALVDEILRHRFGAGIDLSRVNAFLKRDARALLMEGRRRGQSELPAEAFVERGLPPLPKSAPLDGDGNPLAEPEAWWACERLAEQLAAGGTPADPLDVYRAFDDYLTAQGENLGTPGTDLATIGEMVDVYLHGLYGQRRSTTIRFEWRLVLPGRLLRTNGVPDGDGAAWSFPDDRLSAEDRLMTAESVLLRLEPLRALGGRTKYDAVEVERLVELLSRATADAHNRSFLQRAVDAGSLGALRTVPPDEKDFPLVTFDELADLLDPATPPLPGP